MKWAKLLLANVLVWSLGWRAKRDTVKIKGVLDGHDTINPGYGKDCLYYACKMALFPFKSEEIAMKRAFVVLGLLTGCAVPATQVPGMQATSPLTSVPVATALPTATPRPLTSPLFPLPSSSPLLPGLAPTPTPMPAPMASPSPSPLILVAPGELKTLEQADRWLTLGWEGVPGGTAYALYQDGVKVGIFNLYLTHISGLQPATTYTFEIRAVNGNIEGPGTLLTVTTLAPGARSQGGGGATANPSSQAPVITAMSTLTGRPGETLTLTGQNFSAATAVHFNGVPATVFTVDSTTQITVVIPDGATTGPVSVTTAQGTGHSPHPLTIALNRVWYVALAAEGDGSSWGSAFGDLQAALTNPLAQAGDEIWVAAGTYYPGPENAPRTSTFQLREGISVYGGFMGNETRRTQRQPSTHVTVLSGDLNHNDSYSTDDDGLPVIANNGENAFQVLRGANQLTLSGFTVQGGNAWVLNEDIPSLTDFTVLLGGGMFNYSVSPTLSDMIFRYNQGFNGGGMTNYLGATPVLTNLRFEHNIATQGGGGMVNVQANPQMSQVTFSYNEGTSTAGGLYNASLISPLTLTDVHFDHNHAQSGGGISNSSTVAITLNQGSLSHNWAESSGGIGNFYAELHLNNVTLTGNRATLGSGGGISHNNSQGSLSNVTFTENTSENSGGALFLNDAPLTLTNVTFTNNEGRLGGGMYSDDSETELTNVTFVGNTAEGGGGMYNSGSSPTLTGCTFRENEAEYGGGMYNTFAPFSEADATPTLIDTLFEDNIATDRGGGILNHGDFNDTPPHFRPVFTRVTFRGNQAPNGSGGGMYNGFTTYPTLTNVFFIGNSASTGGGFYAREASVSTLNNVVFYANQATSNGAGIYSTGAGTHTTVRHGTFFSNSAASASGAYNIFNSTATFINSIFSLSTLVSNGGTLTLDSVLFDNAASDLSTTGTPVLNNVLSGNPNFVDTAEATLNLSIQGGPARDVGIDAGITTDIRGANRDNQPDLGAYEGAYIP